jgi:hypothetical protein
LSINFSKIGQYLWDRVVKENPQLKDKKVLDELFDWLYGKIDEISTYKNVYNTLDKFPLFFNAITSIYSSAAFSTRTGILIESKWSVTTPQ